VPPIRQADVFGTNSGTLFRKIDISNVIRDGKAVILARKSQLDNHDRRCPRQIVETSVVVIVSLSGLGAATNALLYRESLTPVKLLNMRWEPRCEVRIVSVGIPSPQGLRLFIRYGDVELPLGTLVSIGEIIQRSKSMPWQMCTKPACVSLC
jgi:hypothetical protein